MSYKSIISYFQAQIQPSGSQPGGPEIKLQKLGVYNSCRKQEKTKIYRSKEAVQIYFLYHTSL